MTWIIPIKTFHVQITSKAAAECTWSDRCVYGVSGHTDVPADVPASDGGELQQTRPHAAGARRATGQNHSRYTPDVFMMLTWLYKHTADGLTMLMRLYKHLSVWSSAASCAVWAAPDLLQHELLWSDADDPLRPTAEQRPPTQTTREQLSIYFFDLFFYLDFI